MKTFFKAVAIAFSMFSKIPVPTVSWDKTSMRYSMAFFPLVGAVISVILYGLYLILGLWGLASGFSAALAVFVSVWITGGIHIDGYCDTVDALSSHKDKEEKLRIMKDSHVGAFALIYTVMLMLLQYGAWNQIFTEAKYIWLVLISFVLSRSLGGLAVVYFPCAKEDGLASMFAGSAAKKPIKIAMIIYILLCASAMLWVDILIGGITLVIVMAVFMYFYIMSNKQFGGITGDLIGFNVQLCETAVLLTAAVAGGILK